jgi:hypothetical protein
MSDRTADAAAAIAAIAANAANTIAANAANTIAAANGGDTVSTQDIIKNQRQEIRQLRRELVCEGDRLFNTRANLRRKLRKLRKQTAKDKSTIAAQREHIAELEEKISAAKEELGSDAAESPAAASAAAGITALHPPTLMRTNTVALPWPSKTKLQSAFGGTEKRMRTTGSVAKPKTPTEPRSKTPTESKTGPE